MMNKSSRHLRSMAALAVGALIVLIPGCGKPKAPSPPAEIAPVSPYLPLLQGAAETIGDAPIAAFGECSHFTTVLHEFANDLFRYLVENKGFRVFMLEAAWAGNDILMDFIKSDAPDIEPWMNLCLNAFDSPPTRKTLLYIRDFNKNHPDDPIVMAGMQPEQPLTDYRELRATLDKAGLDLPADIRALIERVVFSGQTFQHDVDVITFHGKMSRQKTRILTSQDETALAAALDAVDGFLKDHEAAITTEVSPSAFEEAKLRVLGLRFYGLVVLPMRDFGLTHPNPTAAEIEKLTHDGYQYGDQWRFEIIKTQRRTRFPGKKIFIWMHSWHAAKDSEPIVCTISGQPPQGTTSVGTRLFREYGSGYRVISSVVAAPASFVYPEGVETIDNLFQKVFGSSPAYVDIHRLGPGQDKLPLDRMLPQYSNVDRTYGGAMVLKDEFDGIAYFPGSKLTFEDK